tara:strand:- start:862 stop:1161 length:300 start_codon:yes stop_codon:yes gene_type:complete
MRNSSFFDVNKFCISNELWPDFINKIGIFKAKLAVHQALDLQRMQGTSFTVPVLIFETCGTALVNSHIIKNHIGLSYVEQGMLLICSTKLSAIQLLRDS